LTYLETSAILISSARAAKLETRDGTLTRRKKMETLNDELNAIANKYEALKEMLQNGETPILVYRKAISMTFFGGRNYDHERSTKTAARAVENLKNVIVDEAMFNDKKREYNGKRDFNFRLDSSLPEINVF
jgi:hypothetical protein